MSRRKFDQVLNLKVSSEMLFAIDVAVATLDGPMRSRSDFLRSAVAYAVYSMSLEPLGDDPATEENYNI